ncbi:hypothetical protein A6V39_04045 [Candidatus Mycoplasma haematobovis]|uniref:Uncharacterized protein n=1 Tax=Candidatus Mycoplasma haematobovis TaxID=432608 RepID=A0A1A9QEE4_9MOLU|nr:hypothetical protein [Candidatus Mycoplasma haematobovis]OAL10060.1 hypothetical protein A6V39_04045 [Candidatus Mycoplasma haematobovis]
MSFPIKACVVGGIGCVTAVAVGLAQPKYSPTLLEKWGEEGYELISSKEKVAEEVWKARATIYKGTANEWLLNDLSKESVDEKGDKIKERCEEYKNKKTRVKDIGEANYEKVTALCTLNIGEYLKSHLSGQDKVISDINNNEDIWKANFKKYEDEIKKKFKNTTEDKATEVLSKFCADTFKLHHSNKHKEDRINASLWCIKREKEPSKLPVAEAPPKDP